MTESVDFFLLVISIFVLILRNWYYQNIDIVENGKTSLNVWEAFNKGVSDFSILFWFPVFRTVFREEAKKHVRKSNILLVLFYCIFLTAILGLIAFRIGYPSNG
ncbi:MAG: hypothetical protein PF692_09345 [Kiritimatiellae bacterium]|jgi:uncharacterized membrane protein YobD (UPF0266 family)|nr:hypothetical protein [Kiritimatiellia bacterium]